MYQIRTCQDENNGMYTVYDDKTNERRKDTYKQRELIFEDGKPPQVVGWFKLLDGQESVTQRGPWGSDRRETNRACS